MVTIAKLHLLQLEKAFVVSLEIAPSAVTARADVVLPVAAVTEKIWIVP